LFRPKKECDGNGGRPEEGITEKELNDIGKSRKIEKIGTPDWGHIKDRGGTPSSKREGTHRRNKRSQSNTETNNGRILGEPISHRGGLRQKERKKGLAHVLRETISIEKKKRKLS